MENLVIVGAGGMGREAAWLVEEINRVQPTWNLLGFLDDNLQALDLLPAHARVLGTLDEYSRLGRPYAVCAVGDSRLRKRLVERLNDIGVRWATLRHPSALIGTGSTVGDGCILCAGFVITVDVRLGDHVLLNVAACCGHDVRIGDFCTLSPHVAVSGQAILEEGVFVGTNAVLLPEAKVGAWALVGAGSVVLRNVSPETTVFGVPARGIGKTR